MILKRNMTPQLMYTVCLSVPPRTQIPRKVQYTQRNSDDASLGHLLALFFCHRYLKLPVCKSRRHKSNSACITKVSEIALVKIEVDEKVRNRSGKITRIFKAMPNQQRLHKTGPRKTPVKWPDSNNDVQPILSMYSKNSSKLKSHPRIIAMSPDSSVEKFIFNGQ